MKSPVTLEYKNSRRSSRKASVIVVQFSPKNILRNFSYTSHYQIFKKSHLPDFREYIPKDEAVLLGTQEQ